MKSLIAFLQVVLEDLGDRCHTSTTHDFNTVVGRIEHEGLSFLTIVLPTFGKDFQKALDVGRVDSQLFQGFRRGRGGLPLFLGGFLDLVFGADCTLLDQPDKEAIRAVHQITSMFGKMHLECTDLRKEAALSGFIECEEAVRQGDAQRTPAMYEAFQRVSHTVFRDTLTEMDRMVYYGELLPKHGPGATADKLKGNLKWNQREWTTRLEEWFPARENLIPHWSHSSELDNVQFLDPGQERPVRVILVPKTLKAPRVIAVEPTCMQYAQQAILEPLVKLLESDNVTKSLIGFTDQLPNQVLAKEGSASMKLATLDLSEASDRVSNQLVRALLSRTPSLQGAVDACRSRSADVPGRGVVRLAKFASMGSALCFPMEAMVFVTIIFMSIEQELGVPLTQALVKRYRGKVRVYGDDIIVPVEFVDRVIANLSAFGLKVNSGKSFWTGKFRESCGGDFYDGFGITPIKVRRMFPTSRTQADEVISMSSLRNQLFHAGFDRAVSFLDERLVGLLGRYPFVKEDSSAIGRHTYGQVTIDRTCPRLHEPQVRAYVAKAKLPASRLDGYGALMKWFLKRSDLPFATEDHLLRAGRPVSVDINTRWVSAL